MSLLIQTHKWNLLVFFAGGIRIGHPTLFDETKDGLAYTNAENNGIDIRHNHIKQKAALVKLVVALGFTPAVTITQ